MSEPVVRVCRVAEVPIGSGLLPAAEADRWQRLAHPEDRRAFLAAHVLVRRVAAELLGIAPSEASALELAHSCPTCGGLDHGRPAIAGHPEAFVSLSHARGVVAAIAAERPCGIDVETHGAGGVPGEMLTRAERDWAAAQADPARAAVRLWTRKEAWAKAHGEGVAWALGTDAVDPDWLSGERHTPEYAAAWVVL